MNRENNCRRFPFDSFCSRLRRAAATTPVALVVAGLFAGDVPAMAQSSEPASSEAEFFAQMGPKQHKKRQKRPVKMGTSAGNVTDFTIDGAFITCCSGTAGALVQKAGRTFILSNNHVFAASNTGAAGDPISQPGMLDNRCRAPENDVIADLTSFKKLKFIGGKNKLDAALAEVREGMVDESGEVIGIGIPGDDTVKPAVGLLVKKSGRTTGVRRGEVTDVNVTVNVGYTASCSSDAAPLVARFVRQFFVQSVNSKSFSEGGDSGAVIYEDVDSCPRAAGLLFAGNLFFTVGTKMDTVLKQLKSFAPKGNTKLVGCSDSSSATSFKAQGALDDIDERRMRLAKRIQARTQMPILDREGVHAMGIGRSKLRADEPVLRIYVDHNRPELRAEMPSELDGIAVEVVESAPFRALNCATPQSLAALGN